MARDTPPPATRERGEWDGEDDPGSSSRGAHVRSSAHSILYPCEVDRARRVTQRLDGMSGGWMAWLEAATRRVTQRLDGMSGGWMAWLEAG